ncbi:MULTISPECIES: peptidoglycan-binding protein [unclassified Roseitalea]|uniref:peptidoglycan-binding protein n=1 Tax=unclassified Roseitalea TaxID=2639107 RepID=UPI00273F6784|nr:MULTISPECIES: peptidoglycan-binding protein [unclassified Roseitalea]
MRDRYDRLERNQQSSQTLDRLSDALEALEDRVGMARPRRQAPRPRPRDVDVEAIRARNSSLNAERDRAEMLRHELARLRQDVDRHFKARPAADPEGLREDFRSERGSAGNLDGLRAEIRALRASVGNIDGLREDIRSLQASAGSVDELREDIRALRSSGSTLSSLRDEIAALRHASGDHQALREDIRSLQAATGNVDELRHEIRAIRPLGDDLSMIRAQIDALKADLADVVRQDAMHDLSDRWSVIEREIAAMPHTLASHDDLAAMAGRIDGVYDAIQDLPRSTALDSLEDQLRALALAVERLVAQDDDSGHGRHAAIEARLDEISRAISTIPAAQPAPSVDADTIDRIEARVAALANQIDRVAENQAGTDLEAQFDALASRIDALRHHGMTVGTVPGEAMDALTARVEDIASAVEEIGHMGIHHAQVAPDLAHHVDQRLSALDAQLQTTTAIAERSAQDVMRSVDTRMDELARLIEHNGRTAADPPSMAHIERQLEDIAAALADGAASASVQAIDTERLEAQIAQLTAGLHADRGATALDDSDILTVARMAAEEAMARATARDGAAPEALDRLTGDLRALETLARDTDTRNSQTFEAIHDTLLKVVDHLASLESNLREGRPIDVDGNGRHPHAEPPHDEASGFEPMRIDDAPPLAADMGARGGPPSPARAAAAAALAALDEAAGPRTSPPPGEERRSILRNVTDKLAIGKGRGETAPQQWSEQAQQSADTAPPDVVDDQPIEPSNDQMALADIMARVRQERSGEPGNGPAAKAAGGAGKSDFIAAARRAAKAAAADATVAAPKPPAGKGNAARGSLTAMLARRRKPLLMGAGAILLALLSVPLIRGLFVDPQVQASRVAQEPAAVVDVTPAAGDRPQAQDTTAQTGADAAVGPQVIGGAPGPAGPMLPGADGSTPMSQAAGLGQSTGQPEAEAPAVVDVSAPAAGATQAETAPARTMFPIAEIPDSAGPIALREAAANGDPKALYVLGDHFTDRGDGDMAEALKWYVRSAELGFAPAQYRAGNFYEKGFGTERDYAAAKAWYQLAAEQGNASAMHNLAVLFASGVDGQPDFDSAARWFLRAAELGVRDSQFNLGILAAKGQGVEQNLIESYKWFALAAKSGDEDAAAKRDDIANVLRPDQLETARGATELWEPRQVDPQANVVTVPDAWRTDAQRTAATGELSDDDMRQAIRNIQAILNSNGFDAGPVDGIMGQRTRNAIMAFQRQNGMQPTGTVDQALVQKLIAINGASG